MFKYNLKNTLIYFPILYLAIAKWRHSKTLIPDKVIDNETEIVIEGFPRSGNTFAYNAFQFAQSRPIKVAHHLHSPIQVITGVKKKIPVLILIRNPEDAILSLIIRDHKISIEQALKDYLFFYSMIKPYIDKVIIADFSEITKDFGLVIQKLNSKFSTDFIEFDHTNDNVERCFEIIEKFNQKKYLKSKILESHIARPSTQRQEVKDYLKQEFINYKSRDLLSKVEIIYNEFFEYSVKRDRDVNHT